MTTTGTRYLDREGGRIAYDDTEGDGPVVLCAPGLGDTRSAYRHLRPLLTARGYRVVTTDLRGGGESAATFSDYTTPAVADDLAALAAELDAGPVLLVANSYSAGASFVAAARAPELIAGLVLTAPFARRQPPPSATVRLAMFAIGRATWAWLAYWSRLFPTHKPADFTEAKRALGASLRRPGHLAALRAMLAADHAPGEAAAPRVRCPVRVVMGTADPDFSDPAAEASAVAGLVADGDVVLIEGCGHYPAAEFPEATAAAVTPVLERVFA
ncbi:alpha/beta fold hydrolase [Prauserella cavernicola]|uniref:Alpha/beta hydrolase n=1 Tax=Prauserella cavernicola TaxID=2800127 RepID=A0A934V324_9PSEU|nr:alpha/beta hydrolase [Prauserella cavernicola]MBK1783129.1 alpha/beta hydrolase [Prauserella cavernicola]